jgi:hypothetical protein
MASITKLTGCEVARSCAPGGAGLSAGAGLSGAAVARPAYLAIREVANERPIQAPAVVASAAARIDAYGINAHAHGAAAGSQIFGQQKTQLHTMWALRGLDPWSDPA